MPKKVIRGSGITKRVVTVYGGDLGVDDFLESLKGESYAYNFDSAINEVERWAVEMLKRGRASMRRFDLDDDSDESYAFRFQHNIGIVRTLIKKKDADKAARFALALGDLIGEARLKFRAERPALLGLSRSKDASSGGIKRAKQKKSESATWQTKILLRVKRMLTAGKSDRNIGALLASDAGRSAETVRKYAAGIRRGDVEK